MKVNLEAHIRLMPTVTTFRLVLQSSNLNRVF